MFYNCELNNNYKSLWVGINILLSIIKFSLDVITIIVNIN